MKTAMNNLKTIFTLTAICFLSFTTATFAADVPKDSNAATLHFIGKVENLPLFRLVINNASTQEYIVRVREASGEIIFSEKLKGGAFARTYKLESENPETIAGTTFELYNRTTQQTTVYKINNLTQTIENFTVAKL